MESRPYSIAADPSRKLLRITFEPIFWHVGVADQFMTDCVHAAIALGCPRGEHLVLVDLREAVLQGQDVVTKMQGLIGEAFARRIAMVASSPLARMQTKRLQIKPGVVLFGTVDEAEAWLFSEKDESVVA